MGGRFFGRNKLPSDHRGVLAAIGPHLLLCAPRARRTRSHKNADASIVPARCRHNCPEDTGLKLLLIQAQRTQECAGIFASLERFRVRTDCPGCHGEIEIGDEHTVVQYVRRLGGTDHHHWHRRCAEELLVPELGNLKRLPAAESSQSKLEARSRRPAGRRDRR